MSHLRPSVRATMSDAVLGRHGVDRGAQLRTDRDRNLFACLLLLYGDLVTNHLAPAHANNVTPSLAGMESQRERKSRLRADRVIRLKDSNVRFLPCRMTLDFDLGVRDAYRRVIAADTSLDRKRDEHPQHLKQISCDRRRRGFGVDHRFDMFTLNQRDWLVAVLLAQTFQDVVSRAGRAGSEASGSQRTPGRAR
jgi:hypothetical protein